MDYYMSRRFRARALGRNSLSGARTIELRQVCSRCAIEVSIELDLYMFCLGLSSSFGNAFPIRAKLSRTRSDGGAQYVDASWRKTVEARRCSRNVCSVGALMSNFYAFQVDAFVQNL